ncbi:MAG: sulfite exporter TauE/SafE family protein [Burkholderiaceae bacterium]|nr:sulfite exporter TauE/SafE family protein [Burkholderiaceae bacterium]
MTLDASTESSSYAPLLQAYTDRLGAARAAAMQGRKVVGYVGNTAPVELIAASGCMPVRIAPAEGDPSAADALIESFADTDMRLIFSQYCAGAYDMLDLLVIPRSTESQHKLYLALREAWRIGRVTRGPALRLYDILHTQRETSRAVGTSSLFGLVIAVPATIGYVISGWSDPRLPAASLGYVNLLGLAFIAPMTWLAAPLGARIAHGLSKRQLSVFFGVFLLIVGGRMLIKTFG